MNPRLRTYAARFDALARRERGAVAAAVLFGVAMLGYTLLIEPELAHYDKQTKILVKAAADLQLSQAQLIAMQAQLKDPDAANRNALRQVRAQLQIVDSKLRQVQNTLVPPDKMQAFLESLLSKNRTLELLALTTLPATPLIGHTEGSGPGTPASAAPIVYKHGIEIKIAGSYNDLLIYLAELERMPERIIWNRNRLSAETYPRNEMTLTLYTLSLERKWLVV